MGPVHLYLLSVLTVIRIVLLRLALLSHQHDQELEYSKKKEDAPYYDKKDKFLFVKVIGDNGNCCSYHDIDYTMDRGHYPITVFPPI